jgi:signal transduction histidine kinase
MTDPDVALLDTLSEGVVIIRGGRVGFINREAGRLLEVAPEGARNLPLIAVLRDHRLERAYLEGVAAELETRGRRLLVRPIPAGLALQDVSELRRAQEEARELLAVLSHELRTPVTTIRSALEALAYELPPAQREHFLGRAKAETERLVRLLADLTVDVKPPRLRRIALREVGDRAVMLLQDTFAEHRVLATAALPELTVLADSDKLLQILINLLENAAIHGPDGRRVSLDGAAKGGFAEVTVRDEGRPLPPESIASLFEPHSRGPTVNAKAKGTGLGLYIVRSIAQRWGGRVWGRALAAGNEFGFSVPLAPP